LLARIVFIATPVHQAALARTFTVDTLADTVALDGDISLREAVRASNANAASGDALAGDLGRDFIQFDEALGNGTIILTNGELVITEELDIDGTTNCPICPVLPKKGASDQAGDQITIDLFNEINISGNNASRAFVIAAAAQIVRMTDVDILQGFANAIGGAICVDPGETLNLTRVKITDSVAGVNGGAIYNNGGRVDLTSSTISGNAANGTNPGEGGGGIFNHGLATLTNTLVTLNTANMGLSDGGGILNDSGPLLAVNSRIINNQAARAGGGIENNFGAVTLTDVVLDGNTTGINGGALHQSGPATATIQGGTITMNTAGQEGGGLWNSSNGTLIVESSGMGGTLIQENSALGTGPEQSGGGVFNDGGTVNITDATIKGNTAMGNDAGEGGGGIFNDGTMMITNSILGANTATNGLGNGGGILNSDGGSLTMTGGNIDGNESARAGGGIENNGGVVILTDVSTIGNTTGINGGGLHTNGTGMVTVNGGSFEANTAGQEGGGLWNSSTGTLTFEASGIGGTTLNGNSANGDSADQGGGGLFNNGGVVSITKATITVNQALGTSGSGGGIFNNAGIVSITQTLITRNDSS